MYLKIMVALFGLIACSQAPAQGTWQSLPSSQHWSVLAIHATLLPDGTLNIMNRGRENDPGEDVFNMEIIEPPYTSAGTILTPMLNNEKRELFCAGHTLDENGNLVIAGGHAIIGVPGDGHGLPDVWRYDWTTRSLTYIQAMREGRWYPTIVKLPNGSMMVSMGTDCYHPNCPGGDCPNCSVAANTIPELWTSSTPSPGLLTVLPERNMNVFYPALLIRPQDGRVFFAATGIPGSGLDHNQPSGLFDPATLSWDGTYGQIPIGLRNVRRYYPSTVMLDGIIYRSGGAIFLGFENEPLFQGVSNSVQFDFATGLWSQLPDMNLGRLDHTLIPLPDGRIIAMGGTSYGTVGGSLERAQPEIYDPSNPLLGWTMVSAPSPGEAIGRGYHSVALLLPDARVLFAGGERGDTPWDVQKTPQFYTPQYGPDPDWQPTRPVIDTAPAECRYGEPITVEVQAHEGRTISNFRLISLGSITHSYNGNQQFVTLGFTSNGGNSYTINPPATVNIATPGYYMLFAIDSNNVPSVAKMIKLRDFDRHFPTTVTLGKGVQTLQGGSVTEILLGDNRYYGGGFQSAGAQVSMNFSSTGSLTGTKVRLTVESRSSETLPERWFIKNWNTGKFDNVWSGTSNTGDAIRTITLDNAAYLLGGNIEARVEWGTVWGIRRPVTVHVDRVEFGVR